MAFVPAVAAWAVLPKRLATRPHVRWPTASLVACSVAAVGLLLWVGANDPTVKWFGDVVTHGPRDRNEVAITFDDGPDPRWTPVVMDILDERDVPGTFFVVGKAVDAFPDVARTVVDRGHLLANHSYHHDSWRWLDPRYPELDRTRDAIRAAVGQCPAFFRPPHGQRTPFMLKHVRNEGMVTVTWEASGSDWSEEDGAAVAERVLDGIQPGAIILLHDGLDGDAGADRSVLVDALPRIIDGLRERGLDPVRLDELLDRPGYLSDC